MTLAEALMRRAALNEKCSLLAERARANAFVQEGDMPIDEPPAMLKEYEEVNRELTELISSINHTNARTIFDGSESIADALARRDSIGSRLSACTQLLDSLKISPGYGSTEIRTILLLDPKTIQQQADALRSEYEQLDVALQRLNWETELA